MSRNEIDEQESSIDHDKAHSRRNRRSSVQFIDKNLIRRRSSGNDKPVSTQPLRLLSINSNCETESSDLDYLQQYSEN